MGRPRSGSARGEVDDGARFGFLQRRQQRIRYPDSREDSHVQCILPLCIGNGGRALQVNPRGTGVVDNNVDTSEDLQRRGGDGLGPFVRADIPLNEFRAFRCLIAGRTGVTTTVAPPSRSRWAMATPMPRVPPVTRARRPANSLDRSRTDFDMATHSLWLGRQTAFWASCGALVGSL